MLVEKDRTGLPFRRGLCIGAGLANSGITIFAINYLYQLMWDFPLIAMSDAVILLTIGAILGLVGGLLAEKYLKFKKNRHFNRNPRRTIKMDKEAILRLPYSSRLSVA